MTSATPIPACAGAEVWYLSARAIDAVVPVEEVVAVAVAVADNAHDVDELDLRKTCLAARFSV